jgi:pSer/pThr/pTyr-binding forkhead associated (FHA) protein
LGIVFCNQCGHLNVDDANFCSSCGALLEPDRADDTTITFMPGEPTGETPDDDLSVSLDLSEGSAMLVVKRGPNAGSKFAMENDVTRAGRHPNSDIFLDDITVSRRHAEVVRREDGYYVRDAGSLNGTYLNRERIDEAPLANGDELQIGKFRLVFFSGGTQAEG